VFDSFQKGKEQAQQWKQQFDQTQTILHIFEDDFTELNPEVYINTGEIQRLSVLLGQIINASPSQDEILSISMIGPSRSGKSSAARFISQELNNQLGENYSQYVEYTTNFWDWWEKTDFRNTQIVFLDGIFPIWNNLTYSSYEDLIKRSNYEKILIITILSTIEYHWLKKKLNALKPKIFESIPYEFYFKRPSTSEIKQIIQQRVEILGLASLFPKKILDSIGILSLGLPGLALWITRHLPFPDQSKDSPNELTLDDLSSTLARLNFEPGLRIVIENNMRITQEQKTSGNKGIWPIIDPLTSISSSLGQSLKQSKKLTNSRLPLLEEMLLMDQIQGTIKRSELQERTGIKDSSLTYQCQNLVKENLISYLKDGREVYYQLTSPIKEALEFLFFE
jgi:DNA-binding MarR family transcriptional regulator